MLKGKGAAYVYKDVLSHHQLRPDHPMQPVRLQYTYELLEAYNAFQDEGSRLVEPRQATEEEVLSFHTPEYLAAVKSFSRGTHLVEPSRFNLSQQGDNPIYSGMYEAALWSTGASVCAAELLLEGKVEVAFNASGGLHHAMAGSASGFCIFNDPVVAINRFLEEGLKVAYIDIDAHHGDGVQEAFYESDQVLTISLHESGQFLFPGTGFVEESGTGRGRGYSINLPFYPYTGDEVYLWGLEEVVPSLVQRFQPDVLVSQLGIDTYHADPITHMALTTRGYIRAVQLLKSLGYPWLALGGGGYDLWAVARCWTLAYGVMAGREWPDEIPSNYLERYSVTRLRDSQEPPEVVAMRERAHRYAEESVSALHRQVFPLHGLSGA